MTPTHEVRKHWGRRSTGLVAITVILAVSSWDSPLLHLGIVDTGELRCRPGRRRRERVRQRAQQIGGKYVASRRSSTTRTPTHTHSRRAQGCEEVPSELVVQNGVGYDTFMNQIESASPTPPERSSSPNTCSGCPTARRIHTSGTTRRRCPRWPSAMAADLVGSNPPTAAYFRARLSAFDASLQPWSAPSPPSRPATPGHRLRHRAGRRLPARGDGQPNRDAVRLPGRHHERRGPLP